MIDYTVDMKVRFHISSNDIDLSIGDLINELAESIDNVGKSVEIQALSYEEGSWFLFKVNDETDKYVKPFLQNKLT
jgi:hypothetical protein